MNVLYDILDVTLGHTPTTIMAPGQLEPYDPRTAKGWRYIHVTDALKVSQSTRHTPPHRQPHPGPPPPRHRRHVRTAPQV